MRYHGYLNQKCHPTLGNADHIISSGRRGVSRREKHRQAALGNCRHRDAASVLLKKHFADFLSGAHMMIYHALGGKAHQR